MDSTTHIKCATCDQSIARSNTHRCCSRCRRAGFKAPPANQHTAVGSLQTGILAEGTSETGNERTIVKGTNEQVRTLEDLIRVCEIDIEIWDIVEWHANKWEMGWKDAEGEAHARPLYQIKARLRRQSPIILTMQALRKELIKDIREFVVADASFKFTDADYLFEFAPFDLHMGKLAWGQETVTDYDIPIAEDLFNASLDYLLSRAQRLTNGAIGRVLCVFGNDVSHIDNKKGETTAGTHLDVDTRYIKLYRRVVAVHRRAVDILRQVAPVDIVVVPGNHDELTSFHLGEVLASIYENDPMVSIDNNPHLRKYYEFGVNLFGFTHGNCEKVGELPLLMARESPEAWARCSSREWHIGHLHKSEGWEARARFQQDFTSDKGIRVRRLTSMSGHDAWHTKYGYGDRRACEAFVFHKTAGFCSHLSFNIDHHNGRPISRLED